MQRLGLNFPENRAVLRLHEKRFVRRLIDLVEHPEPLSNELQIVRFLRARDLVELLDALGDRGDILRVRESRSRNRARHCRQKRPPGVLFIRPLQSLTPSRLGVSDDWTMDDGRWTMDDPPAPLSHLGIPGSIALNARAKCPGNVGRASRLVAGACSRADGACRAARRKQRNRRSRADPYQAEIVKFQQDREATLKADTGWLTIGGLWFLTQPETTFGSDPLNDIVLPERRTVPCRYLCPARRQGHRESGRRRDVSTRRTRRSRRRISDPTVWARPIEFRSATCSCGCTTAVSGCRSGCAIRTTRCGGISRHAAGSRSTPRIASRPSTRRTTSRRSIDVPNILGDIDRMTIPGIVTFTLNGQEHKLEPVAEAGSAHQFWFIFRDLTSQKETYPAARFLYTPLPSNGRMILDFNKAQNPPCAYNPYTTCPLPTEQNRLRIRIEAGEMRYGKWSRVKSTQSMVLRELKNFTFILAGVLSAGLGLKGFLLPSGFIDGGVTGVSLLLARLTSLPLSVWLPLINVPFIAVGYRHLGAAFAVRSSLAIVVLALVIAFVHFPDVTPDPRADRDLRRVLSRRGDWPRDERRRRARRHRDRRTPHQQGEHDLARWRRHPRCSTSSSSSSRWPCSASRPRCTRS